MTALLAPTDWRIALRSEVETTIGGMLTGIEGTVTTTTTTLKGDRITPHMTEVAEMHMHILVRHILATTVIVVEAGVAIDIPGGLFQLEKQRKNGPFRSCTESEDRRAALPTLDEPKIVSSHYA